jgi:nicotinamide phosphoribosyltransferase
MSQSVNKPFVNPYTKMPALRSLPYNTDSYKVSMPAQYPPGTEYVYSYIESRGGEFDRVLHAGGQAFYDYLAMPVTEEEVLLANTLWTAHGEPFPLEGWLYIARELGGKIPVKIRSVAEGLVIPTRNVLVTIENTDPKVPWITTWVETGLLRAVWYMSTVATTSWHIKQILKTYLEKSSDDMSGLLFKLHDFGARGVSSQESAEIGGAAHLINFMGTDTFSAIMFLMNYYDGKIEEIGFSIPASEHSTITSWTRVKEASAYKNMINTFAGEGKIFACVMDSYDILEATNIASTGEHLALLKEKGGLMVLRPDSDDPLVIIPKMLKILERNNGSVTNKKGYKVLNNFRIIWGDGINLLTISSILRIAVDVMGYSADNFAFGMGGALLQKHDRDSQEYAMKCSAARINGEWVDVYKQPAGIVSKASKKGRVTMYLDEQNRYFTGLVGQHGTDCLHDVFMNGEVLKRWPLVEVRANSNLPPLENAPAGHSSSVYEKMA